MKVIFLVLFLFVILLLKFSYELEDFISTNGWVKKFILILSMTIIVDLIFLYLINIKFFNLIGIIVIAITLSRIFKLKRKIEN